MQIPLQITFEAGLAPSDALRARITREAMKLERFRDRIAACRVAVIGRGGKRRHGGLYSVRLQLMGPGLGEVVITRNPPADHTHEDAFLAVRDAFAAARRRVQDRRGRLTGRVKTHAAPPKSQVAELLARSVDAEDMPFYGAAVSGADFELAAEAR